MEDINIEADKSMPEIKTDFNNGKIKIHGKSYPENTYEFYEPLMLQLEKFFKQEDTKKLQVDINITYFNSSSSRVFYELFELFEDNKEKYDITINWIYDEDDEITFDVGSEFKEDFEDLINLVKN